MTLDTAFILSTLPAFLKAVGVTLQVGLIAIATSLLVALVNATLLVLRTPYLWRLVKAYVELARNTPLLIQLFFVCFALPSLGLKISGFSAAIITMTFMGGAYLTEVLRAGIEAVPRAQLESGRSIGLSEGQLLRHVVLPQAGILSLPALFANFIFLLKETTVVSAVAVPEILYTTKNYIALYLLLRYAERRLQHGQFGI
jgi:polar amino acid transport system permease protein